MMKIIVARIYQRDELSLKVTGLKVLGFCAYKLNTLHSQSASQQREYNDIYGMTGKP